MPSIAGVAAVSVTVTPTDFSAFAVPSISEILIIMGFALRVSTLASAFTAGAAIFFAAGTAVSLTTIRSAPVSALGADTTLMTVGAAFAVSILLSALGVATVTAGLGLAAVSTTDTPLIFFGSSLPVRSSILMRMGSAFAVSTLASAFATGAAMFFATGTAVSLTTIRSATASVLGEDTILITLGAAFAVSTLVSALGATLATDDFGLTAVSTTDTPLTFFGATLSVRSAMLMRTGSAFAVSTLLSGFATGAAMFFATGTAVSLTTMRSAPASAFLGADTTLITVGTAFVVSTFTSAFGVATATEGFGVAAVSTTDTPLTFFGATLSVRSAIFIIAGVAV